MKKENKQVDKKVAEFNFKTITSFEKACEKEGIDPNALPNMDGCLDEFKKAIIAVYKLFIIHKAINNGWIPRMGDVNQLKYWAYHWVLSSGLGFGGSDYGCGGTYALVGSRLCTFSPEGAMFIAETFTQEWADFKLNIQ